MCVQKKEGSEMTRHESGEDMKRKKESSVCVTLGLTGHFSVLCRGARPVTSYLAQRSWDVTGDASRDAVMCTCTLVLYLFHY